MAAPGSSPEAAEPQPPAAATPDPGIDPATQAAVSRNWLRRWRRITQPTPPDVDQGRSRGGDTKVSLLDRNPLQIGFFLTIGAMAAYGLVTAVFTLRSILVLVLLSMAIALGLNPAVTWLHHHGFRRGIAVLMVALGLIILLVLGGWALVPVISEQVNKLMLQAPDYLENLRSNAQIAAFDAQFGVIDKAVSYLTSGDLISGLFGGLVGAGQAVASGIFSVIITIVLTLYFLTTLPSIKEVIYQLAPPHAGRGCATWPTRCSSGSAATCRDCSPSC